MTDIPFYWLDIFTESKFKGNPAAVCILEEELEDSQYQSIAKELNLSETAFPIKKGQSEYKLRWFTPTIEMPLCGHATMATAYTLHKEFNTKSPITFHTISGDLIVEVNGNEVTLNFPRWSFNEKPKPELLHVLGVGETNPVYYIEEMQTYGVVLDNQEQVEQLDPNFQNLLDFSTENSVMAVLVTAKGESEYDYVYRVFAPFIGVNEDPGTGIAHCSLGHYWGNVLGKKTMKSFQLSERQSEFTVGLIENGVGITGKATPLIKGTISI